MRSAILALALIFTLSATTPATAGPKQLVSDENKPEQMLGEGADLILRALKMMIDNIPQYQAPEVLKNGDIIIRRVQPDEKKPDQKDSEKEQTRT